jgi:3-methyladenine DNA glycosylase/8-oxoguanine DNA glycosylase
MKHKMQQIASLWKPYRTLVIKHLWSFKDQ